MPIAPTRQPTANASARGNARARARALFEREFGPLPASGAVAVHAPGRTEIAGNHTDHEGGRVMAGAISAAIEGVAAPNGTGEIRVASEGYPGFSVSLAHLAPQPEERQGTAALVRGMAAGLARTGREPQGFDLALASTIPAGGGLSSSAAVEAALGRAMELLWTGPDLDAVELARLAQSVENEYFGKPCGLMDQLAVCLGGLSLMDFADADRPKIARRDFDFTAAGYALCLVDVGCDHTPFTAEYAAVAREMQQVAEVFGAERLCEVDRARFDARVPALRERLGDRAVLRALHYWRENELVDARWAALAAGDMESFLAATRASGASSAMYLQNVSAGGRYQPAMVALALAEHALAGRGAARIHGGGFGGSIQAFVPLELLEGFAARMDGWLGAGACTTYTIAPEGACATCL